MPAGRRHKLRAFSPHRATLEEQALSIARALVSETLGRVCESHSGPISSVSRGREAIEDEREDLLLIKTRADYLCEGGTARGELPPTKFRGPIAVAGYADPAIHKVAARVDRPGTTIGNRDQETFADDQDCDLRARCECRRAHIPALIAPTVRKLSPLQKLASSRKRIGSRLQSGPIERFVREIIRISPRARREHPDRSALYAESSACEQTTKALASGEHVLREKRWGRPTVLQP